MDSLSNYRWQTRKERPNRCTNKRDMTESAFRYVVREGVSELVTPKLESSGASENIKMQYMQ